MKKRLITIMTVILLLACAACISCAFAEPLDDYCGIWVGDGVDAQIWREEDEARCRIVFTDGEESDVWEYSACWYDTDEAALICDSVTRTRERYDALWETLQELDWSMADLCFSRFELTESGLVFTDDMLDDPIAFTSLHEAEGEVRREELAFVGRWTGESALLQVADHGVAYLFTVTVPEDADRSYRWTYTSRYDSDGGRMASAPVTSRRVIIREADGTVVEEEESCDIDKATFVLGESDELTWLGAPDGREVRFGRMQE